MVKKQFNVCDFFITETPNYEKLKPHTSDHFEAHTTDNTGTFFHWEFLTALKPCPHRAQPPLPEYAPAQLQTWRVLPVLVQLPQQPDPRPGRNSGHPAPGPQQSGQRCHPELQPGTCPQHPGSLKIVHGSSQETELFSARQHISVCLCFLSCSMRPQQGRVTTLIFVNLKWADLHSNKLILIKNEIYMLVLLADIFGDHMFRHVHFKISVTVLIRSPN